MIEISSVFSFPIFDFLFALGVIFFLYAETHYHFRFAPSLLYRRRPEIIADAPHRLEPGHALPILVIIKDAHRFPVTLQRVRAEIALVRAVLPSPARHSGSHQRARLEFTLQEQREEVSSAWWWRIYFVELPAEFASNLEVNVGIAYRCRGKNFVCWNDNHVGTSHAPLQVFRSLWPLPTLPNYYHGDLHFHSDATDDQVEFGAPVEAVIAMGRAQGLSFCGITDHSYDLDDFPDDYLHNDPALRKWHALQARIQKLNNAHDGFVLIPGEEVSCGNAAGDNVHFLIFNHPHFIAGSGDGGEKWLHTTPDHSIREILDVLDENALAFAAHPAAPVPFLQRKLLRRGCWQAQDLAHPRLHGMQFWNGGAKGEEDGQRLWLDFLVQGKKLTAIAGNDAHGNFNRFRQVSLPCLKMVEHPRHVFGRFHTAIKLKTRPQLHGVLAALRSGSAIITNGVFVELELVPEDDEISWPGAPANQGINRLCLRATSTPEFGRLERVMIWRGDLEVKREEVFYENQKFAEEYRFEVVLNLPSWQGNSYLRGEVCSSSETSPLSSQALSNPIWIVAPA